MTIVHVIMSMREHVTPFDRVYARRRVKPCKLTLYALSARTSRLTVSFSVKSDYPSLITDAERELRIRRIRGVKMRNTSMKVNFQLASVLQESALISFFCSWFCNSTNYSRRHERSFYITCYNGNILLFCLPNLYTRIMFFEILCTTS